MIRGYGYRWPSTGKLPNTINVRAPEFASLLIVPAVANFEPPPTYPPELPESGPGMTYAGTTWPAKLANAVPTGPPNAGFPFLSFGAPIGGPGPKPTSDPGAGLEWYNAQGWTWQDQAPGWWIPFSVWRTRPIPAPQAAPIVTIKPTVTTALETNPKTGETKVTVTDGLGGKYSGVFGSKSEAKAFAEDAKAGKVLSDAEKAAAAAGGGAPPSSGPSIPAWAWVAGLGVVAFILLRKPKP